MDTRVESLLMQGGCVKGINIKQRTKPKPRSTQKLSSTPKAYPHDSYAKQASNPSTPKVLVYAVETEITGAQDIEMNAVEVYFGKGYAPGFYGWLIPRPDGTAKLGLATNQGDPRAYLKRLMTKHPVASKQLAKAKITTAGYHAISLGRTYQASIHIWFLGYG